MKSQTVYTLIILIGYNDYKENNYAGKTLEYLMILLSDFSFHFFVNKNYTLLAKMSKTCKTACHWGSTLYVYMQINNPLVKGLKAPSECKTFMQTA